MSFVLTTIGLLLLVISLAGIALGLYMAAARRTRSRGRLFAILWVPALAASTGVLMRDVVTFTVGLLCFLIAGTVFALQGDVPNDTPADRKADLAANRFLVAGTVFALQGDKPYEPPASTKIDLARGPAGTRSLASEKTTKENETRGQGRVAS